MTTISQLDVFEIQEQLEDMLTRNEQVGLRGVHIEIASEPPAPSQQDEQGWVGIYRERVLYPSRTVGIGRGFRYHNVQQILLLQECDLTSGKACAARLEKLVKNVMDCLLNDTTLGGKVQDIDDIEIHYPRYNRENGVQVQNAIIFFTAIGLVNAS